MKKEPQSFNLYLTYCLKVDKLSIVRGDRELICNSSFIINRGEKCFLIGRNGGGKTTLLEIIVAKARGQELPEGVEINGILELGTQTKLAYFPQEVLLQFEGTVDEYLDNCAGRIAEINRRYERLQIEAERGCSSLEEYGETIDEMNYVNGWDYPDKKMSLIRSLGFNEECLRRDIASLSGGERNKIALAGTLISDPNFLILDEPTNNLDRNSLQALVSWLQASKASCLMVSHDRSFMDAVADKIFEIDEHDKVISTFGGNYSFYLSQKKLQWEAQLRAYEAQKERRERLLASARELHNRSQEFEEISTSASYRAKAAKIAKRAKVQQGRIEKELSSLQEPKPPKRPSFIVFEPKEIDKGLLLSLTSASFGYNENNLIFSDFSLNLHKGDRLAIVGENGSGKTTFVRVLTGELALDEGSICITGSMAYLPQTYGSIDLKQKVLDFFRSQAPMSEDDAKKIIGQALFRDVSKENLSMLSEGERKRVQLAAIFAKMPDLIILDEPTNHLDIPTIEMLEEAISKFKGGLIVVSHDEWFLNSVDPQRYVVFRKNKQPEVLGKHSSFV